jgi:hypothetical protein
MWSLVKPGGAVMSLTLQAIGLYALSREAATWGFSAWIWLVASYLLLVASGISIIVSLRKENKRLKQATGVTFHKQRPSMKEFASFIQRYDKIWAIYGTGESLESNKAYDVSRFERLILLNPDGNHFITMPKDFHLNDKSQMKRKVEEVIQYVKNAVKKQGGNTKIRLFDGCTLFSLTIGNPLSGNGGIFLETYVPYEPGYKRPSIMFSEKDAPELFKTLCESYEHVWNDAEKDI